MKKNTYTPDDIDELKAWFETHCETMPASMQIDDSTYTANLQDTVQRLLEQAYLCCTNPKMQGSIVLLQRIKSKLETGMA